jgi:hypothetical protein
MIASYNAGNGIAARDHKTENFRGELHVDELILTWTPQSDYIGPTLFPGS